MKKIFLFACTLLAFFAVQAQSQAVQTQTQVSPVEVLSLKETEFDFGKIQQSKPVYHSFEITNKSNKPLKLDNVAASCGCTTPEWSREEIAAGGKAIIKVGYNAATEGPFTKDITITYNGNQTKVLKITGHVWKAPVGSAPVNAPVSFLKQQIK